MKAKQWKQIVRELGSRHITFENIANGEKMGGLEDVLDQANATMNDYVLLAQYAKAMTGDTKSAEFLRDTAGEKPQNDIHLTSVNPFDEYSLEELEKMRKYVKDNVDGR